MRGRNRREIRRLARQATERARAPASSAPPPAPSLPAEIMPPPPGPTPAPVQEMVCVCGEALRIPTLLHQKRCACPSCRRKFVASFSTDRKTGLEILSPVYVDDGMMTGGTHVAEVVVGARTRAPARTEALFEGIPPDPPPSLSFACPCGARLRAGKADYDKRVQCGTCGARLILALVYDSGKKDHRIEVLRLGDSPTGETRFLES